MQQQQQDTTSRAIVRSRSRDVVVVVSTRNKNNAQGHATATTATFGTMVKKFMEKRSNLKPGSANRAALPAPPIQIFSDSEPKKMKKVGNLATLHRKLFHKGGNGGSTSSSSADRSNAKALTEVKSNTRTLAMVLRSERELLTLTKEYEEEIQELRLLVEEKNREVK